MTNTLVTAAWRLVVGNRFSFSLKGGGGSIRRAVHSGFGGCVVVVPLWFCGCSLVYGLQDLSSMAVSLPSSMAALPLFVLLALPIRVLL